MMCDPFKGTVRRINIRDPLNRLQLLKAVTLSVLIFFLLLWLPG